MDPGESKKLSFSFSSSSKPAPKPPRPNQPQFTAAADSSPAADASNRHYLTNFNAADALKPLVEKPVIAPIPNHEFHKKSLPLPSQLDDPNLAANAAAKFVLDTSSDHSSASTVAYGLTLRGKNIKQEEAIEQIKVKNIDEDKEEIKTKIIEEAEEEIKVRIKEEGANKRGGNNGEDLMVRRFREDMEMLSEDRGEEEFRDVKVEDFAAAVLKGYGWSEGGVIGRNRNVPVPKVFEYRRKGGSEGLGFNPSEEDPKKKRGVWVPGDDGKRKKAKENPKNKIEFVEKSIRVVSGRFKGLKGKLVKRLDATEFLVKLDGSGNEVGLEDDMFVESGSVEEDEFLRRVKKSEMRESNGKRDDRKSYKKSSDGYRGSSESVSVEKEKAVRWLRSHIRVKIISKELRGGKLYLKKGRVIDVVGPTTCDISMDESGELVQGVNQGLLETALPKTGGPVLVLYGRHKGIFGNLMKRNTEDETGIVRDADSHELITVHLDEIAEYTGDPSDLGY